MTTNQTIVKFAIYFLFVLLFTFHMNIVLYYLMMLFAYVAILNFSEYLAKNLVT